MEEEYEQKFIPYIFKVQGQVCPYVNITYESFIAINKIIISIIYKFIRKFNQIKDFNKTVENILDQELLRHAISEISKANMKFHDNSIAVNTNLTRAQKSGIVFSVFVVEKTIKEITENFNPDDDFLVNLTIMLEYITAEILEVSSRSIMITRKILTFRTLRKNIKKDDELRKLLKKCYISFNKASKSVIIPKLELLQMDDFTFVKSECDLMIEEVDFHRKIDGFFMSYANDNDIYFDDDIEYRNFRLYEKDI